MRELAWVALLQNMRDSVILSHFCEELASIKVVTFEWKDAPFPKTSIA
jgi:hypothetical protein